MTRTPLSRSEVKVTRPLCSPPCWRVRRLQRWTWERVGRGKLLLRCRLLGGARRFGAQGGEEGRWHIAAAARLQLVIISCHYYENRANTYAQRLKRQMHSIYPCTTSSSDYKQEDPSRIHKTSNKTNQQFYKQLHFNCVKNVCSI